MYERRINDLEREVRRILAHNSEAQGARGPGGPSYAGNSRGAGGPSYTGPSRGAGGPGPPHKDRGDRQGDRGPARYAEHNGDKTRPSEGGRDRQTGPRFVGQIGGDLDPRADAAYDPPSETSNTEEFKTFMVRESTSNAGAAWGTGEKRGTEHQALLILHEAPRPFNDSLESSSSMPELVSSSADSSFEHTIVPTKDRGGHSTGD